MDWIAQQQDDVPEDEFDAIAMQRGWAGHARDHTRFARYFFTVLSNRADGTPQRLVTQRGSECLEMAAHGVCASDQRDGERTHKEITGDPSSEKCIGREQRNW